MRVLKTHFCAVAGVLGALLLLGCSSSGSTGAGASGASSSSGAGGRSSAGGGAGGASGGSLAASGGNGAGGSGQAGSLGTDLDVCINLQLTVGGAAGPHGTIALFKTSGFADRAYGLALVGGDLYFISNGMLQHIPSAGGTPTVVGALPIARTLVTGSTLVWFEPPVAPATTSRVLSAPISDISKPAVLAEGVAQPQQAAVDTDTVFFDSRSPDNIFSVPLAGGTPKILVPGSSPLGMISDGANLYWLDFTSSFLERVPKAGGAPQMLAEAFFGGPMARDSTYIYWADTSQNSINRWGMGDTMVTRMWGTGDPFNSPESIFVLDSNVYWTQGTFCTGLWEYGLDFPKAQLLVNGFRDSGVFASDSTHLYVGATDGIYRVDR